MAFIVFEGLDASGKSTLMESVKTELETRKIQFNFFRDPGSTQLGEKLRHLILATDIEAPVPKAEILLYQAARVQMIEKNIKPVLGNNSWVLCDRFYSSTVAFQSFARGLDLKDVEQLNTFVAGDCEPDLFILLDISVSESEKRKSRRASELKVAQDRMEIEASRFQEKVREGYLYQARQNPKKWLVLDGTMSPDQLSREVVTALKDRKWLN